MAELAVTPVTLAGVAPAYVPATAGGDHFIPSGGGIHLIHIKNGHTASQTVTLDDPTSVQPANAIAWNPDVAIAVPNAGERMIAIDPARFRDRADGRVDLTYSGVTALTIAVFRLL